MRCTDINGAFVSYYGSLGYIGLPTASLLDPSIPMSFVMSAGIVQIENGLRSKLAQRGDKYLLVQKCFRHFDVDRVKTSPIHLSLFDMPGSFRFGLDESDDVIARMWHFLTQVLQLPKQRLWITYFAGGRVANQNYAEDVTARTTWHKLGIKNLVGRGPDTNFWLQGGGIQGTEKRRKCGPNTEIYFDRGSEFTCGPNCLPSCTCSRFVEVANSLFVRYELDLSKDVTLPLDLPFSETVIGTERVAMVTQYRQSVYEIEQIQPLVEIVEQRCATRLPPAHVDCSTVHILVDHMRAIYHLVADGAPGPGKDGRHRIMRKLIREVLTQQLLLGLDETNVLDELLHQIAKLAPASDDAQRQTTTATVQTYIESEYAKFQRTVENGKQWIASWASKNTSSLADGSKILALEKEMGMPIALILLEFQKRDWSFPDQAYGAALRNWKAITVDQNSRRRSIR